MAVVCHDRFKLYAYSIREELEYLRPNALKDLTMRMKIKGNL